jgi:hypothetical protein
MCRVIQCGTCHKPTWAGCGAHVEQVLGHVPKLARCACRDASSRTKPAASTSPAGAGVAGAIRRIFGG